MVQTAGPCPRREWVLKSSLLVAMAVYTYLRLIVDHHGTAQLQALRQKEVGFCTALLRERVSATRRGLWGLWGWLGAGCVSIALRPPRREAGQSVRVGHAPRSPGAFPGQLVDTRTPDTGCPCVPTVGKRDCDSSTLRSPT